MKTEEAKSVLKQVYYPSPAKVATAILMTGGLFFAMKATWTYGITGEGFGFPLPMEVSMASPTGLGTESPEVETTTKFSALTTGINLLAWYVVSSPAVQRLQKVVK